MKIKAFVRRVIWTGIIGLVLRVSGAPLTESDESSVQDLDGNMLQEMAKELEKPMLQLIGKAIETLEIRINGKICDLHPCSQWEEWTGCNAHANHFGAKFRTRECGVNYTACDSDTRAKKKESEICIGYCPENYNITKNGYCVKLYNMQTTRLEADMQCKQNDGNLINIDSDRKYRDIKDFVESQNFVSQFWIDGQRRYDSSVWEYEYGSTDGFFQWASGEPSNGVGEECLAVKGFRMLWNDVSCSDVFYAMCEVIEH